MISNVNEMTLEARNKVVQYLQSHHEIIVNSWKSMILDTYEEPFIEKIIVNMNITLGALRDYFMTLKLDSIKPLTQKIARERIEANTSIGAFVSYINIGRRVVSENLMESPFHTCIQKRMVLEANEFFNQLFYLAITEYSHLKDMMLEKKNMFIQEMHQDRLTILGQIASSFAHEFRNPLTAIKGFIYLLQSEKEKTDKTDYYFSIINDEMESLEEKISQFLLLSKMKGFEDQMELFSLSSLIREMIDFLYPRFLETNILVNTQLEDDLPFEGVKSQIKQVLLNILYNAVDELCKHSGEREIKVRAYEENKWLKIDISNNGDPIPSHLIDNIFEPFISTKELGTGLGLSVCKQIVEKHNGRIYVQTEEKWTTFTIELPAFI
ncbi:histidine kinase N-terminal domain-containing protein [Fictibacillus gelatini]|uniref:histidine kinase N-terminal domain-containing protein n=1 Tax=Fictibacillus gelatini TaxID=225985 RepID=UPI001378F7E3|nr:histidine kinase N-terminal domain-containing protein [Fictibacillus gelatini]